jgi:two-component system cell cycle sensor histidine kinase/response regulator CckA
VTEQRASRLALQASEERFRCVFDQAAVGLAMAAPDGRFVRVNPRFCEILDRDAADLLGRTFVEVTHPDDRAATEAMAAELRTGTGARYTMEKRNLRADGRGTWVRVTASLIRDASGAPAHYLALVEDLAPQKQAEREARWAREQQAALLDALPDPAWRKDEDGRYVAANAALAHTLGMSVEDVLGLRDSDLLPPSIAGEIEAADREAMRTGRTVAGESTYVDRDGRERWMDVVKVPFVDADGVCHGTVGIAHDITHRKEMEAALKARDLELQQAQKMEAIGQLAGGVAHDFNNLLSVIQGTADLILMDAEPGSAVRADVEEIRHAAEQGASVTRQLLAFSRKQRLEPAAVDLNAEIRRSEKMLRRLLGEDVRLETSLQDGIPPLFVDAGQMEQVILNLAVNARDAMPEGGRLLVTTRAVDDCPLLAAEHPDARGCVCLSVSDTGCGIDPEALPHIFEPFFTTKGPGQGTGLGLSTVYGIVRQSGGQVMVESVPGQGTTFRIFLPPAPGGTATQPAPQRPAEARAGRGTLLLVEDEDALRAVAGRILRRAGYTVLEAGDGEEALEAFRAASPPPDAVVTDVVMPLAGGRQLADRLRALRPALPVLFVSGYPDERISGTGVLAPGERFLQKPYTPEALLRAISQALDGEPDEAARDVA